MGSSSSTLHPEVIQSLRKTTNFSSAEIRQLYRQFRHDCRQNKSSKTTLTVDEMQRVYEDTFPDYEDSSRFAEHVFRTFDKDQNGKVDFKEFVSTLSIQLRGNFEERLEWVFELYDINGNMEISKEEVLEIISALYDLHSGCLPIEDRVTPEVLSNILFRNIEDPNNESMSQKTFLLAARESNTMRSLLEGTTEAAIHPYVSRPELFERRRATSLSKSKSGKSR